MMCDSIQDSKQTFAENIDGDDVSIAVTDPLMGTTAVHGQTNRRPKAYAGEYIPCPWDAITSPLLRYNTACLVPNDYPALSSDRYSYQSLLLDDLYPIESALGVCYVVIYSEDHEKHWLTLSKEERENVVHLWAESTRMIRKNKKLRYTHIFENDGPINTMTHPHGQQYAFVSVPLYIQDELRRCMLFYKYRKQNLFQKIQEVEMRNKKRIIIENESWFAYAPPGARWPFQVRILPKRSVLWLDMLTDRELSDLAESLTMIRHVYARYFSHSYRPTIMMNIFQSPCDRSYLKYQRYYRMRVEFFVTALSSNAEKLMFSIENSTGYSLYSQTPEETASILRSLLMKREVTENTNRNKLYKKCCTKEEYYEK